MTREDAIEILNTPDEKIDELIAKAEKLRRKYKGDNVGIHILTNARSGNCSQDCATVPNPVVPMLISTSTAGYLMKSYSKIMIS